ncbi:hypothetical protein OED52_10965 [Rhodococcus sp. Z13]|uniref:Uncharacterized protein n=1 Tax=Rhodococcus sacchari TaxID=2962047 RepID=A0ACD4DB32_9NOCA|nr:hypothetical protein [Rhodococcus sp. Z13]UYP17252.1 hypothetical protein OED52_10965 [Rhodococcus sp. Z13]
MSPRRTARLVTALCAAALTAVLPAQAAAQPAAPGVPLDELRTRVADSPEILAALERLAADADTGSANPFAPPPKNIPQPFTEKAPTFGPGCGGGFVPFAMTTAWVHPGPHGDVPFGQIEVFVEPTVGAPVVGSDLTFVWINVENFRAGVANLENHGWLQSAVVDSGPGAIMGALFGSIDYGNGTFCQVVYTMGGFFA